VSGEPMGFYHFTGFDSGDHQLMLEKYPVQRPVIEELMNSYREALSEADRLFSDTGWSFEFFSDGTPVSGACRRSFRDNPGLQEAYPDPWHCSEALLATTPTSQGEGSVSLGYVGAEPALDGSKLIQLAMSAAKSPKLAADMARAAGRIVKTEGWYGIRRRLIKERKS